MFCHFHWLEGSLPAAHPEKCWVLHSGSGPSSSSCKITSSVGQVSVDRDSSSRAIRAGLHRRLLGQVWAMPPALGLIKCLNRENLPNPPISASAEPPNHPSAPGLSLLSNS